MTNSRNIQLALEDMLADLQFARKNEQLGKLALLAYCDVKHWARRAGKTDVAELALRMFSQNPCQSKKDFLQVMDRLIALLQQHANESQTSTTWFPPVDFIAPYPSSLTPGL